MQVLRPYSQLSNLEVWEYYLEETLCHGPIYDPELVALERGPKGGEPPHAMPTPLLSRPPGAGAASSASSGVARRTLHPCYDDVPDAQPDVFTQLLEVGQCQGREIPLFFECRRR